MGHIRTPRRCRLSRTMGQMNTEPHSHCPLVSAFYFSSCRNESSSEGRGGEESQGGRECRRGYLLEGTEPIVPVFPGLKKLSGVALESRCGTWEHLPLFWRTQLRSQRPSMPPVPRHPMSSSVLHRHQPHMWHTDRHAGKTLRHIK